MTAAFTRISAAALIVGMSFTGVLADDVRAVPSSQSDVMMSYAPLVKQTTPAVVNVYAERMVTRRMSPLFSDPFFGQFFGQQMPGRSEKQMSLGSGVIVAKDGIVITNNHVIADADDVRVALSDGREFPCKVLMKDDRYDLAVLKITSDETFPTIPIGDSDAVQVGDISLAIGNPFGVGQTVTSGIISGLARNSITDGEFGFFLQTDAAINPGNSGGPLVDMNGRMIGMNTAIATSTRSSAGVGFAVPVNMVRWVSRQLIEEGQVKRAWLGVAVRPVDSQLARQFDIKIGAGAIIGQVMEGSPAAKAGLTPKDIIQTFDSQAIDGPRKLQSIVERLEVGKTYPVKVLRDGKTQTIKVTVAEMPASDRIRSRRRERPRE